MKMATLVTSFLALCWGICAYAESLQLSQRQLEKIYNSLDRESQQHSGDDTLQRSDDVTCVLKAANACQFVVSGKIIAEAEGSIEIFALLPHRDAYRGTGTVNCFQKGKGPDFSYYCTVD
jgi:hypothetical protein